MKLVPPYSNRWSSLVAGFLPWLFAAVAGAVTTNDFLGTRDDPATSGINESAPIVSGPSGYAMAYRWYVPAGYDAANAYPLIVFLHGAGEVGDDDNHSQISGGTGGAGGSFRLLEDINNPCFMVAPQLPGGSWSGAGYQQTLQAIIGVLKSTYNIDANRIYVTGLSYGGAGTWSSLYRYPNVFAAGIPIAGSITHDVRAEFASFGHIPIWMFHGDNDTVQSTGNSDFATARLRDFGFNPLYTKFDNTGHSGWTDAYRAKGVREWLFAQTLGNPATGPTVCTITTPTSAPTHSTSSPSLNLQGTTNLSALQTTAAAGYDIGPVESMTWRVINPTTFQQTASGNAASGDSFVNWTATVPLQIGENLVQVVASGPSWTTKAGTATFNDTLRVIYTLDGSGDITPPALAISSPTTLGSYGASASSLNLSGTASDNIAVSSVAWVNSRGGSGTAVGTNDWSVTGIPLQLGLNVITVTASDNAGGTATRVLNVTYSLSNQAPVVSAGPVSPIKIWLPASATLDGTVTDDGLPTTSVTTAWTKQSGPGGAVTFGNTGSIDTTATFPTDGTFVLRLTAADSAPASASSDLTVRVFAQGEYDFTGIDLSSATPSGSFSYSSTTQTYTVNGGGANIFTFSDTAYFAWVPFSGTGTIIANVATSTALKAGIMMRESLAGDSRHVAVVDAGTVAAFHRRVDESGSTLNNNSPSIGTGSVKLKLERLPGHQFKAYRWNGSSWVQFGSTQTVEMTDDLYVGLVVSGGAYGGVTELRTATFDAVEIFQDGLDNVLPTVTIQNPSDQPTYNTGSATIDLGGIASDNVGVSSVTWSNDRGGNGTASGTTTWTAAGVALELGTNVVTVVAHDSSGNIASDVISVEYALTNHAPVVNAGTDLAVTLPGHATLNASVSDDALPASSVVVTGWSQVSGPAAAIFGDPAQVDTLVGFPVIGTYVFRLTASDGELAATDDVAVQVSGGAGVVAAINCGEFTTPFLASDGNTYAIDVNPPYSGGSAAGVASEIAGTEDDAIYQRYRYSNHSYNIPCPPGTYEVVLKFADNVAAEARVFNVTMEGVDVLTNFDIRAEVASNTALDKKFTVDVSGGTLNIVFTNVTGSAKINGILVRQPQPYQTWEDAIPEADRGETANPDVDDLANLGEFFFGSDPLSGAEGGALLPGLAPMGEDDYFTVTFDQAELAEGVIAEVQCSPDLGNWETIGTVIGGLPRGPGFVNETSGSGIRTLTFRSLYAVQEDPCGFFRVVLTKP